MKSNKKTSCFEVISEHSNGSRTGILTTRKGKIITPVFMPDGTRGVVKSMLAEQVRATGIQAILANTYHLHISPGEEVVRRSGGVHGFGKWSGPILTDSGGFQVFSLGKLTRVTEEGVEFSNPINGDRDFISPEKSIQIQIALGSDMIVAFDHLIGLDEMRSRRLVIDAFNRTHRWLERSISEFKRLTQDMSEEKRPLLFGVVQGGLDQELRKQSLEYIQKSDVDCIAIGGLSVGETREEMFEVLSFLEPMYDSLRPRFLLGVGDPTDLRFAYTHGIDMADCVLPTRNARHATVWVFGDNKMNLTNSCYKEDFSVIDSRCDCYTCQSGYSRAFLRHQFKVAEPLAGTLCSIHNLRYLTKLCEDYR